MNLFRLLLVGNIMLASAAYGASDVAAIISAKQSDEKTLKAIVTKENVSLYNFSEDLLKAAAECSIYSEDFSQNNPNVKSAMSEMFGNTDFTVPVEILGKDGDLCHFTVGYSLNGVGGTKYDCRLTDEQKAELIAAMQDRSTELVTETFTVPQIDEADGPVETTMTAGKFDIVLNKLQATACKAKEILPSDAETEEAQKRFQQLPNEFISALANCESAEISREVVFFTQKTTIIGWNEDKCHVTYDDFDLNIPRAELGNILTYNDLDRLCENPEIAVYDYTKNYDYENLMFTLKNCRNNRSASQRLSNRTTGILETRNGLEAQYRDGACHLTFVNEVAVKDNKKDYSVVCMAEESIISEILEPYKPLIEAYEKVSAGEKNITAADGRELSDMIKVADGKVMYELQIRNLCRLKDSPQ